MSLNLPICHACNTTLSRKQRTTITKNVTNPPYLGAQLKKCDPMWLTPGPWEIATHLWFILCSGHISGVGCQLSMLWPFWFSCMSCPRAGVMPMTCQGIPRIWQPCFKAYISISDQLKVNVHLHPWFSFGTLSVQWQEFLDRACHWCEIEFRHFMIFTWFIQSLVCVRMESLLSDNLIKVPFIELPWLGCEQRPAEDCQIMQPNFKLTHQCVRYSESDSFQLNFGYKQTSLTLTSGYEINLIYTILYLIS